jgi:serine protease Do
MKAFGKLVLICTIVAAALVTSGFLDIRVDWSDSDASALDLFGSDDEDVAAGQESFWQEGANRPPIAPIGVPGNFADLAEEASRGVVNISAEKTIVGHPLEEFFGMPNFPFQVPQERFREHKRQIPSLGTGFVISPDGYIVTNNHVVEDVEKITVRFDDQRELPAVIIGRDPKTDIALIKVEAEEPLFALPLGNSDVVRPGEWVVAIGNPFGLEHTVTAGIVSAKHRDIDQGAYDDYIQTDAAINPGNSGGPLINLAGEVIGINTAINPRANTIGFAVPIDMAKGILPQLRATGRVTRGWLGVVIQGVTPEIAEELDLEDSQGALVSKVIDDGPADEAGIEKMDVIREFDGKRVDDYDDLPRIVASTPVDKKVEIVVIRDGKKVTLRPRIAKLEEPDLQKASVTPTQEGSTDDFGLRVQDLTDDLAEQLGLEETRGVVVSSVDPGGPAADAGIRRGDVIIEVDRREVNDSSALEAVLGDADDRALMLIRRGENQLYMTVKRAG